jgi:hypothetical protein
MTEPTSQHLYVMQNEFGCIKIGRSVDPWERRRNLCQSEHCKVELVAAFEGGGEDEEAIHIELDEHRLEGEWFNGLSEARAAVERIFHLHSSEWKFEHDPDGAAKWLDHLRVVRQAKYIYRAVTRQIGSLRMATEPSWVHDCGIFFCRYLAETGERPGISVERRRGKVVNVWYPPESSKGQVLPAYTSSLEAALLVWPDDLRPDTWEGSPIDCCIAALTEIRARLPKVPRR